MTFFPVRGDTPICSPDLISKNKVTKKKNRNKEKGESKNLTTDELFGKMIGEDLKALPPTPKPQARSEIQNIIFKYRRMGSMQDSLQGKLNSTASIDGFSPSKNAGQFVSQNNFGNGYQSFSPNASSSSSSNSGNHWIHGMNETHTNLLRFCIIKFIFQL